MVNIKIVVEGGVLPNDNVDADTFNNSEKFRESFHQLLSKNFEPTDFNLEIEIGAGYKQSVKSFKELHKIHNCILLIDLDGPKTEKNNKQVELELTEHIGYVFFMVQEMEAWILSQPNCIVAAYSETLKRKQPEKRIEDDEIFKLTAEEITNPAEKLHTLLGRYFRQEKNGKMKNKKYGKLKDAPLLLANLDPVMLKKDFEDVDSLYSYIQDS